MNHHIGELAYFDTFSGLVPCKVIGVTEHEVSPQLVTVKLTARRGAYRRGEVLDLHPHYVVPRRCIITKSGQYRIRGSWSWLSASPATAATGAAHKR